MNEQNLVQNPVIDESHINKFFLWKVAFIAAMGGLLFGYDFMVIGGTTSFYYKFFNIMENPWLKGLSTGAAPIGCIIGAGMSMLLGDKFGRKKLLFVSAILFLVSAIGTALVSNYWMFNIMRLIGGGGIGLAAAMAPIYIAEMAPSSYRGKIVTTNQFTIMIGIVVSQIVNYFIQQHGEKVAETTAVAASIAMTWNETMGWRLMFGAEAIPAVGFMILILFVPFSPRWLVKRGRNDEAEEILKKVGGNEYAKTEVADIASTISEEEIARINFKDLLEPKLLKIICLGMFLAVVQQWSGLNSIFAYSHQIFKEAGYDISGAMLSLVYQGVTMMVFCVVAMFVVDKIGRKKLMLFGALGICIIHVAMGFIFKHNIGGLPVVILVMAAIAIYAATLAPVVWVLLAELFPNRLRSVAMGISVMALWVAYFILIFTFPIMSEGLGMPITFWTYAAFLFIAFVIMKLYLPETKGKSLEQIERELVD